MEKQTEWNELVVQVPRTQADTAEAVLTVLANGGLYIEDYANLEADVLAIAHIDLIEQELLDKPRDIVLFHLYFSPEQDMAAVLEEMHARLLTAGVQAAVTQDTVKEEDWATAWKQYYHPIEIGSRLAVVPSWEEYKSDRVVLRLDPGMAFGTGTHETTWLCLEWLDEVIKGGEDLLDVGTGSGILAIAGLLLGAAHADAVDIDAMAVRTAGENAQRNGVAQNLQVIIGDLAQKIKGTYQVVTANIVADAICRLAPALPVLLAPSGRLITSGIILEKQEAVEQAMQQAGLQVLEVRKKNGWVALVAGR